MLRTTWVFLLTVAINIQPIISQDRQRSKRETTDGEILISETYYPCHSLAPENYTCSACIQLHDTCAWCEDSEYNEKAQFPRCDSLQNLLDNGCFENKIVSPRTTIRTVEDEELRDGDEENEDIQIKPQVVDIEIRPKSRVRFNVTFREAHDYPVDLYYLMDLSYSMKDDKSKLEQLGGLLSDRMKQISKNFRLGFGSFVDKKVLPFVDARPEKQESPCAEGCAKTYGYKHMMTLTTNTDKFSNEVNRAVISQSLDRPEGGFDALIQAIVCKNTIGWRERSLKIIVFSTDADFHFAGDGRLAGIVTPNDGECHLDREGYYTKSAEQDYPSIALLRKKLKENKINMIFAVTKNFRGIYEQLSRTLSGVSSSVVALNNDSSNIVTIIEEEYEKIAEQIIMVDNANALMGLKLSYRSKCLTGSELIDTNVCEGIKVGGHVTFEVTLEVTHCVAQRDFVIKIGPSGLDDALILRVKVLCDCDCEKNVVINAPECGGRGNLICGMCHCIYPYIGEQCECDSNGESAVALEWKCRKDNNSLICSDRGSCNCGVCDCFPRANPNEIVSGSYCECSNFNCPRYNRMFCGGHGKCVCSTCECELGWTGEACECAISTDSCLSKNEKICNDHGTCICGECICEDDYVGPYCEICPKCLPACTEHKHCVMCQQWGTGIYNESRCAECPFKVIPVKELPVLNLTEADGSWDKCQFVDPSDDSTFYFLYYDNGRSNLTVWVKEKANANHETIMKYDQIASQLEERLQRIKDDIRLLNRKSNEDECVLGECKNDIVIILVILLSFIIFLMLTLLLLFILLLYILLKKYRPWSIFSTRSNSSESGYGQGNDWLQRMTIGSKTPEVASLIDLRLSNERVEHTQNNNEHGPSMSLL